jgi:hypothetical protein
MLPRLFLFIILFFSATILGQERQNLKQTEIKLQRLETTKKAVSSLPETFAPQKTDKVIKVRNFDAYLPWIFALIVSFVSVFTNIILVKRFRVSQQENMKQLNENLEKSLHATNATNINLQLMKIEQHFQTQIERLEYLLHISHSTILKNNNKIEWLNEVRLCISNYMTQVSYIKPGVTDFLEEEEFKKTVERALFYKSKAEILLTEKKYDEKKILEALREFSEILTVEEMNFNHELYITTRDNLIDATRHLFKNYQHIMKNN